VLNLVVPDSHSYGTLAADQYHQSLSTGYRRIQQVALQHDIVLRQERNHHRGILTAMGFVYGYGIGQHQLVQIASLVAYYPIFKSDEELLFLKVNPDCPVSDGESDKLGQGKP